MNDFNESDDVLADLLNEIKNDPTVKRTKYFSSKFLNSVAEGFERNGFEETKLFLVDKKNRKGQLYQAEALLSVIKIFENEKYKIIKNNRKIGRLIIKTLDTLISDKKVNTK